MNIGFKHILFIFSICSVSTVFSEGFPAGTFVKAVGRSVPIEKLQVGDGVYCCNAAGMPCVKLVSAVQLRETATSIHIVFEHEDIFCEENQLFWRADDDAWCKAKELAVGDIIKGFSKNEQVMRIGRSTYKQQLYEIEVEDSHNFYVSESEVLTHNMVLVLAAPAAAPVISSAVVVTVVQTASAVSFVAGCVYSFCWGNSSKKNKPTSTVSGGGNSNGCICGCGPCSVGCNCGCILCGCGTKNDEWEKNKISKQEFFKSEAIKKNYEHVRDGIYQLKKGGVPLVKGANYLQWDHLHNDVEVYRTPKAHIGSLDPNTLKLYKNPVAGRKLSL